MAAINRQNGLATHPPRGNNPSTRRMEGAESLPLPQQPVRRGGRGTALPEIDFPEIDSPELRRSKSQAAGVSSAALDDALAHLAKPEVQAYLTPEPRRDSRRSLDSGIQDLEIPTGSSGKEDRRSSLEREIAAYLEDPVTL